MNEPSTCQPVRPTPAMQRRHQGQTRNLQRPRSARSLQVAYQRRTCTAMLPVVADPEDIGMRALGVLIECGLQLAEPAADAHLHRRQQVVIVVIGMHTVSWVCSVDTSWAGMRAGRHLILSADDALVPEHDDLVPAVTSPPSLWGKHSVVCVSHWSWGQLRAAEGQRSRHWTHLLTSRLMRSMTLGSIGCVSEKLRTSSPNGDPSSGSAEYAWSAAGVGALMP